VKEDRVVYLEQRVGALKPELYREISPGEPPNEIDLRWIDGNGATFFVQRGGDTYVDSEWSADINAGFVNPVPAAHRDADFALAKEAASEIAKAMPRDLATLAYHPAVYATRPVPSQDPLLLAKLDEIKAAGINTEVQYANFDQGGQWWLEGDLYDKSTSWGLARHSGVAMWAYSYASGSWQLAILACNHGTCPGSMGYSGCYSTGGIFNGIAIGGETTGSTGTVSGGCLTPYSWNSGGYDHLCNDDSAYELWQIKYGSRGGGTLDTHGDGSWVHYACTCSNNAGCDNDWSRPYCP
jgi:hypothetical protein